MNPIRPIITLTINGLNIPIKSQRLSDPSLSHLKETHIKYKGTDKLKEEWKKMQTLSMLIADEVYFKTKRITRHKEEYFTMINEENITILTIYVPSN